MEGNVLYYGDNLDVLRLHIKDESVDLIYLDPPFNSNATYNVLFAEHGTKSAAQIHAFEDTWQWDQAAAYDYEQTVEQGGMVADTLRGLRTVLGTSDMLAYLSMMAPRLIELRRVLARTGSIWLHCDPTASHYLKTLMDAVFGPVQFRNEVIWKRADAHNDARQGMARLGRIHDVLLLYAKGKGTTWNPVYMSLPESTVEKWYRHVDADGRRYNLADLSARKPGGDTSYEFLGARPPEGRFWAWSRENMERLHAEGRIVKTPTGKLYQKRYLDESKGVAAQDLWTDISMLRGFSGSEERLGYPTQKPLALLERILQLTSNPGDTVLDPFCGCGTTVAAAQALGRRWIGIDITHLAIGLIKHRLADIYGPSIATTYQVIGEPTDIDGARELAASDPFQFQAWALGLVGARIATSAKKSGDKGIDGRLYFHEGGGDTKQIIISVKAGHLQSTFVDALVGVVQKESAQIGVMISFNKPTQGMRGVAASAGFYESPWGKHPRIQLLTIEELLKGAKIDYPHVTGANVTHKKAARYKAPAGQQLQLAAEPPSPEYSADADDEPSD